MLKVLAGLGWRQATLLVTVAAAVACLILGVIWTHTASAARITVQDLILMPALIAGIVASQAYPIHVRQESKLLMGTVPLYLSSVLLPPLPALATVLIGVTVGECITHKQKGSYLSDAATQVSRWVVIAFAGTMAAQLRFPVGAFDQLPLLIAAAVEWSGDVLTTPLLLSPIMQRSPSSIMRLVVREGGSVEAAQYLIAILGAVAASKASWTLLILFLPTALVYRAFKNVKDMREHARQMLAGVVEASPDAILLLSLEGRTLLANAQAASLLGDGNADAMHDLPIDNVIRAVDGTPLDEDFRSVLAGESIVGREYCVSRHDGRQLVLDVSWTPVREAGRQRAATFVARDITHRKIAEQALTHQALHDPLTNLPNRTLLHDRLRGCLQRWHEDQMPFAVCLMDLNRFKHVNDTYGHNAGDRVLEEVASRLRHMLRDTDTIARLGGDEFALLLPGAESAGSAIVAGRIVEAVGQPILCDDLELEVGASLGIALCPRDACDEGALLHAADEAMYAIKRKGGGFTFAGCGKDALRSA